MMIRVLIAEDHTLVRDGIRSILQRHEEISVVGEACDGVEAVAMAATLHPDVVLMDISMPLMNGVEATRTIKAQDARIVVLVLTAYDDDAYVFASLEAGAAGYLMKSLPGDQLAQAIRGAHEGEAVLAQAVASKVMARLMNSNGTDGLTPTAALTALEVEVLRLAGSGLANQAIAHELELSQRTVQLHLAHIFEKLRVGSRTEAVIIALKRGWLQLEQIQ
jgi:DNA-binding NarL/FixJ family response regulator